MPLMSLSIRSELSDSDRHNVAYPRDIIIFLMGQVATAYASIHLKKNLKNFETSSGPEK